jgi:VanZ family protein
MKGRRILSILLVVLILATLAFIWGNSMKSVEDSQEISLGVLARIKPVLGIFVGAGNVTDHLVRKLAHFTEFAALGLELVLLVILLGRVRFQTVMNCAFFGLASAVVDETIQIFSDRGSQVQDVWLDFAGLCAGLLVALIIYTPIKARHRRTQ